MLGTGCNFILLIENGFLKTKTISFVVNSKRSNTLDSSKRATVTMDDDILNRDVSMAVVKEKINFRDC